MKPPKVVSTLYINPIPLAVQIETVAGSFLQSCENGVYLLGKTEPVLVPGREYFQSTTDKYGRPTIAAINGGTPITGDVYDASGDVVLLRNRLSLLRDSSHLPVQGLKIVQSVFEWAVEANSEWIDRAGLIDFDEMLGEFIISEYEFLSRKQPINSPPITYYQFHHYALRALGKILHQVEATVADFIGHGVEDRWVMHFVERVNFTDLALIKSIDYRIHDWTRRTKSGWK